MIDSIENLKSHIGTGLYEAEQEDVDREDAAELLERYAEAVRNGHSKIPEERGKWYQEVHGESEANERVPADD